MKVLCIDDSSEEQGVEGEGDFYIKEGEVYTVATECIGVRVDGSEEPSYELAEDLGWAYSQKKFLPLSSIDETTFNREYNKQTV